MKTPLRDWMEGRTIYDLSQPYFIGIPHFPTHPPFLYSLTKKHGEFVTAEGVSSAADSIALGTHGGTHIDALCHFSRDGKLFGGVDVMNSQSYCDGIGEASIDTLKPMWRRGVLLDIPTLLGVPRLTPDFAVTSAHLAEAASRQAVEVEAGDVVLVRTGWGQLWNSPQEFVTGGGTEVRGPGPNLEAARWLSSRGIYAAGSDTLAFEKIPGPGLPVHVHLLVESGIFILENLLLEELARDQVSEFLFVGAPLKIKGSTGAPIRPLAIV